VQIDAALNRALDRFIERDKHLLEVNASERSMSHQIAIYLSEQVPGYNVDCEYNRHGFNAKELHLNPPGTSAFDTEAVTVFPDIIVHRRGNDKHNLLVVEMKKAATSRNSDFDRQKLKAFRGQLHYTWAAHLIIGHAYSGELVRTVEWIDG
jgi:hypothetical protein